MSAVVAVCVAGGAVQHRAYADGAGRLVSDGRDAGGAGGAGERLAGELGVDLRPSTDIVRITDGEWPGLPVWSRAAGEVDPASAPSCRTWTVCGRCAELVQGAPGGEVLRAAVEAGPGVFGGGAVSRAETRRTSTWRTTTSCSRKRSGGGVPLDLRQGGAGAGPDVLPGRDGADGARCGAGGGRGAVCAGAYAVPAAAP